MVILKEVCKSNIWFEISNEEKHRCKTLMPKNIEHRIKIDVGVAVLVTVILIIIQKRGFSHI